MTTPPADSPGPNESVALALANLGKVMEVGLTRIDGQLALLVQRHDQTDLRIAEHDRRLDDHDRRIDAVERGETERQKRNDGRLDSLEKSRWPLPSIAALVAVLGLVLAAYQAWSG